MNIYILQVVVMTAALFFNQTTFASNVKRTAVNSYTYDFHPHVVSSKGKERLTVGFDVEKHIEIHHQKIDIEIDVDIEESLSEQEVHGGVEASAHGRFVDLHLRASVDTGFFYRNMLETEISLGKTIELFDHFKISPEVHLLRSDNELETDFVIKVFREI